MVRKLYRTDIEEVMEEALKKANIDYTFQFPIRGAYILDFAIPELKIDIECDGEPFHIKGNNHDRKRNWFLRGRGWKVLRFTGKKITENTDVCINKIKTEIKNKEV